MKRFYKKNRIILLGTWLDALKVKGDWVRAGQNQWCMSRMDGVEYLRWLDEI